MARVKYDLPISTLLVAFDASYVTAAVVYTYISQPDADLLWDRTVKRHARKDLTPKEDPVLDQITKKYNWKIAAHHTWTFDDDNRPHINVLESIAGNMAIDWIAKKSKNPVRVTVLSNSGVVIGSYSKGRSSILWLLKNKKVSSSLPSYRPQTHRHAHSY